MTWNINDETGINKVKSRKESGQSVLNRGSSTYKVGDRIGQHRQNAVECVKRSS